MVVRSALTWGAGLEDAWAAFVVHDHYIWHSARPRSRQGTVEIRCACQQPWDEHMAVAALSLGSSVPPKNSRPSSKTNSTDAWEIMRRWHADVIRSGLAVPEPVDGFTLGVLERAKGALRGRGRKAALLDPLFRRLEQGMNPAQRARALLQQMASTR